MRYLLFFAASLLLLLCIPSIDCHGCPGAQETGSSKLDDDQQAGAEGNNSDASHDQADQLATDGFVKLFDGLTTAGWKNPYEWGQVDVVDGEIHLTAEKKFFLVTEKTFSNFELICEVCLPAEGPANSGVMFRCHVEPNRVFGYQAECDPSDRAWTGGLYDEGRRAWLYPEGQERGKTRLFQAPQGEWIRYRIVCVGSRLQIRVNDKVITDFVDDMDASGHIGIQHHGEKGQTYRFRNIAIREISDGEPFPEGDSGKDESASNGSTEDDSLDSNVEGGKTTGSEAGADGGKPD